MRALEAERWAGSWPEVAPFPATHHLGLANAQRFDGLYTTSTEVLLLLRREVRAAVYSS